ncbi:MAG TPA: TadE/TadG family type IV pilus assembly protein [Terriglobales bacterium]|jgi:Flp pilus assembly protein TadG|nr:TadE/TadG family type IV pilus assembly protein [Terriglobales bacterium]
MLRLDSLRHRSVSVLQDAQGAALLEFAISLPLLVLFVVGIYDFSGAFNQKQKIEQAAQEGAIVAGAQPMSDIVVSNGNPDSLQPVVTAVFNSLLASGVLPNGTTCTAPGRVSGPAPGLTWTYTISACTKTEGNLVIAINRGLVCPACTAAPPAAVATVVTVSYPYAWRFNSVIQLLFPGSTGYASPTITESATVHNQT